MLLKVAAQPSGNPTITGWDIAALTSVGTIISGVTDQDTSTATNIDLVVDTAFAASTSLSSLTDQSHHGWPQEVWDRINYSRQENSDPAAVFRLTGGSDLVVGQDYLIKIAGGWTDDNDVEYTVNTVSATYDNTSQSTPITPAAPVEITATATDDGSGNGELQFTVDYSAVGNRNYLTGFTVTEASAPLSITSVTDSAGSTADQITEDQNATIQLSEDATVSSAELQNSGGTRTAALTIQSSTSNSVTVQGARGALRYGDTDNKVVLTLSDSSTIEATGITFAAPANVGYVNGASIDTTSDNSFGKGMSSTPSDYQFAWTDNNGVDPTVNSDLTVSSVAQEGTVTAELYDNTDGTWGSEVSYSLELDTTVTRLATIKMGIKRSIRAGIKV